MGWLDRLLPWRRIESAHESEPTVRVRDWPAMPPVQRVVAAPSLISGPARFADELVSHRDPSFRGPVVHEVDAEAPSGFVAGLDSNPVAVQRHSDASGSATEHRPAVMQREFAAPAGSAGPAGSTGPVGSARPVGSAGPAVLARLGQPGSEFVSAGHVFEPEIRPVPIVPTPASSTPASVASLSQDSSPASDLSVAQYDSEPSGPLPPNESGDAPESRADDPAATKDTPSDPAPPHLDSTMPVQRSISPLRPRRYGLGAPLPETNEPTHSTPPFVQRSLGEGDSGLAYPSPAELPGIQRSYVGGTHDVIHRAAELSADARTEPVLPPTPPAMSASAPLPIQRAESYDDYSEIGWAPDSSGESVSTSEHAMPTLERSVPTSGPPIPTVEQPVPTSESPIPTPEQPTPISEELVPISDRTAPTIGAIDTAISVDGPLPVPAISPDTTLRPGTASESTHWPASAAGPGTIPDSANRPAFPRELDIVPDSPVNPAVPSESSAAQTFTATAPPSFTAPSLATRTLQRRTGQPDTHIPSGPLPPRAETPVQRTATDPAVPEYWSSSMEFDTNSPTPAPPPPAPTEPSSTAPGVVGTVGMFAPPTMVQRSAGWQPVGRTNTALRASATAQRLPATNAPISGPSTVMSRPRPVSPEPSRTAIPASLQRIIGIGSSTGFSRAATTTASAADPLSARTADHVPDAPVWSPMQLQRVAGPTPPSAADIAAAFAHNATPEPPKTTEHAEPTVARLPDTATTTDPSGRASTDAAPISANATAAHGTPTPSGTSPTDIDALVARLYDPIVRKLKAELRLDRERAGTALDLTL